MKHVQHQLEQRDRRVCRVLGQARSAQRYAAIPRDGMNAEEFEGVREAQALAASGRH